MDKPKTHAHKREHQDHEMCHVCNQCKDCHSCSCKTATGPALKKMMIVVSEAGIDSIYAGLIMANGARSEGIECDMFFTFFGLDTITKKRMDHLKIGVAGNPGMHIPEMLGVFPGMDSMATHMLMKRMDELDIPPVHEFLDIIKATGGGIYACKLAMEMFKLSKEDLWEETDGILSIGQFYERYAPGTQIIFI